MADVTIPLVGGAGHIGRPKRLDFATKGVKPVVFDNVSSEHPEFVKSDPAKEGGIRVRARLDEVTARHNPSPSCISRH